MAWGVGLVHIEACSMVQLLSFCDLCMRRMWWLNTTVQTISNCGTKLVLTGRPWAVFYLQELSNFMKNYIYNIHVQAHIGHFMAFMKDSSFGINIDP